MFELQTHTEVRTDLYSGAHSHASSGVTCKTVVWRAAPRRRRGVVAQRQPPHSQSAPLSDGLASAAAPRNAFSSALVPNCEWVAEEGTPHWGWRWRERGVPNCGCCEPSDRSLPGSWL